MTVSWGPDIAYYFFLVFARLGTIMMLLPALGEQAIPSRLRLTFALAFAFILYPLVLPQLGPVPDTVAALTVALCDRWSN